MLGLKFKWDAIFWPRERSACTTIPPKNITWAHVQIHLHFRPYSLFLGSRAPPLGWSLRISTVDPQGEGRVWGSGHMGNGKQQEQHWGSNHCTLFNVPCCLILGSALPPTLITWTARRTILSCYLSGKNMWKSHLSPVCYPDAADFMGDTWVS